MALPSCVTSIGPDGKIEGDRACKRCRIWYADMIDLNTTYCRERLSKGCKKTAQFGNKEDGRRHCCADHKEEGMINLRSTRCDCCGSTANYGIVGGPRTHCAKHKKDGMVDRRTGKSKSNVVARQAKAAVTAVDVAREAFVEARAVAMDPITRNGEREAVDPGAALTHVDAAGVDGLVSLMETVEIARVQGGSTAPAVATGQVAPEPPSECDGGSQNAVTQLADRFVGLQMGQRVAAAPGSRHVEPIGGLDVLAEAALIAQVGWEGGEAAAAEEGDREERVSPAAAAAVGGLVAPSACDGGATEMVARLQGAGQWAGAATSGAGPAASGPVPEAVAGDVMTRRSNRKPGTSAVQSPGVVQLLAEIRENDSAVEVLKLHNRISADSSAPVIDAVLDALMANSNCQALYIQNQSRGLKDKQLLELANVLRRGNIWCLNAGENSGITVSAWWRFVEAIGETNVTVSTSQCSR